MRTEVEGIQAGDPFPVEALPHALEGPAVVYFYPADFTPGCEAEARGFNALHDSFSEAGVQVVGVSVDSAERHEEFTQSCELAFPLVSDEGGSLTERLGLIKDYGEYGRLARRVTLLLDREGTVRQVWRVQDVATHPAEVLEAALALSAIDTRAARGGQSRPVGREDDMPGYVIAESDVRARTDEGDTAATRVAIDASRGCEHLEQRVIRFAPGRSSERSPGDRQEVLYVAAGAGSLHVEGDRHPLEPDTGAYLVPGSRYAIENEGPGELVVISVTAPLEGTPARARDVTVRAADRPVLAAGKDREFRYLVNQDLGCPDVTQFVGVIPPGRAPQHSHTYDEVVYVVEGEGVLHLGGAETPIAAGSCMHLPPLEEHCLENTGSGPMRVLGVFHPSGDPASRAYEEGEQGAADLPTNRLVQKEDAMKKAGSLLLVVALTALALAAGRASGPASASPLAAVACDGLPVGFMGPITGPVAFLGAEQLHWAQYALDSFNKANKTTFTLQQADTQLNPSLAQTGGTKLVADKSVLGVVGPAGSQEVQAIGALFKKAGLPYISASATNATLTNGKYPTFFRVVGSDKTQATTDARFMVKKLKAKKVFLVDDQESYSTGIATTAQAVLRGLGVKVDRQSVNQKVTDFSALVSKIDDDTDVVFLPWQVAANAQLFYQQMREQGKKAKIFGSDGLDSGDFKADGRYISSFARDIRGTPGTAGLIKTYESRYGNKWGTFGPPTYVAIQSMLTAMKAACKDGKSSRGEVLRSLRKVKLAKTILGLPLSFNARGDNPHAKFYVYQITGSKRTLVG